MMIARIEAAEREAAMLSALADAYIALKKSHEWLVKDLENALTRIDEQVVWRQREEARAEISESRCATLENALRKIKEISQDELKDSVVWAAVFEITSSALLAATSPIPSPTEEMNRSDVCSQSEPC